MFSARAAPRMSPAAVKTPRASSQAFWRLLEAAEVHERGALGEARLREEEQLPLLARLRGGAPGRLLLPLEVGERLRRVGLREVEARILRGGRRELAQGLDRRQGVLAPARRRLGRREPEAVVEAVREEDEEAAVDLDRAVPLAAHLPEGRLDREAVLAREPARELEGAAGPRSRARLS